MTHREESVSGESGVSSGEISNEERGRWHKKRGGGSKKDKTQRRREDRRRRPGKKAKREQHLGFQRGPPPQY